VGVEEEGSGIAGLVGTKVALEERGEEEEEEEEAVSNAAGPGPPPAARTAEAPVEEPANAPIMSVPNVL